MMNAHQAQQGFTLIEVLVALTLMALVSLISWRGLEAVQNTGERLDDRAEETLSIVRALGQIERDILLHAGPDILPDPTSVATPDVRGGPFRMPPGIVWNDSTGLNLVRAAGEGRWQQLRWYLEDGALRRAVGAPSHLLPLPPIETSVIVIEQVQALTVRIWQPGQGWVDPTQGGSQSGSPSGESIIGLEIALYRQGSASDKPYRKVVLLP